MAFALLIVGGALLVSSVRGTSAELFALIAGDFRGPRNFLYWVVAILVIGAIGYVPKAKPLSTALLGLVVMVLFLSKGDPGAVGGGFFDQFGKGLGATDKATAPAAAASGGSQEPALVVGPGRVIEPPKPLSSRIQ